MYSVALLQQQYAFVHTRARTDGHRARAHAGAQHSGTGAAQAGRSHPRLEPACFSSMSKNDNQVEEVLPLSLPLERSMPLYRALRCCSHRQGPHYLWFAACTGRMHNFGKRAPKGAASTLQQLMALRALIPNFAWPGLALAAALV